MVSQKVPAASTVYRDDSPLPLSLFCPLITLFGICAVPNAAGRLTVVAVDVDVVVVAPNRVFRYSYYARRVDNGGENRSTTDANCVTER